MNVLCDFCNYNHEMTPTQMKAIIETIQDGDLQVVTGKGVQTKCLNMVPVVQDRRDARQKKVTIRSVN